MTSLEVIYVPVDELHPADWNPRFMPEGQREALRNSLSEFGAVEPAVVRPSDKLIIGGHQRVEAAVSLGWKDYPCVFHECTDEEAKLLNIALNRISGAWEMDKLSDLLVELRDVGANLDVTGFESEEVEDLLDRLGDSEDGPSEFPSPDVESGLVSCPRCAYQFRPGSDVT